MINKTKSPGCKKNNKLRQNKRNQVKITRTHCQSQKNHDRFTEDIKYIHLSSFCCKQALSLIGPWFEIIHQKSYHSFFTMPVLICGFHKSQKILNVKTISRLFCFDWWRSDPTKLLYNLWFISSSHSVLIEVQVGLSFWGFVINHLKLRNIFYVALMLNCDQNLSSDLYS